jgi:hypothetical protein
LRRQEAWLEVKWTNGPLGKALQSALRKACQLQSIASEEHTWALDKRLGGAVLPAPSFVGGLAVCSKGWRMELTDVRDKCTERWSGAFESAATVTTAMRAASAMKAARAVKAATFRRPLKAMKAMKKKTKHTKYNTSSSGLARYATYRCKPSVKKGQKAFQRAYAATAAGRTARAEARQRYNAKRRG